MIDIPPQMRALVLDGSGFEHLQVKRVPTPRPGPKQMLARVDAAGICTSLIKLVEQGPEHKFVHGWDLSRYPLILGDEGTVTLAEVGSELQKSYQPDERYVIQPAVDHAPIVHRERYRDGAKGVNKVAVGYTLGGHLAEYILITEEILAAHCLLPLPDSAIPYAHAAICEPLSCIISAQDHHLHLVQDSPLAPRRTLKGLKPGGVIVIIGAGAMGRMHVDLAMNYRPRAVVVTDLIPSRLELVKKLFGPRARHLNVDLHAVNSKETAAEEFIKELTDYQGADDVIVAVGSGRAIESAQKLTGRGAVLNLFGGLKKGEETIKLDSGIVHYREINVTGSSGGSPWDMARTLELIAVGDIDVGAHIAMIGDLDHAGDLLAKVRAQEIDGKAVVYPHRRTQDCFSVSGWTSADERNYLSGANG